MTTYFFWGLGELKVNAKRSEREAILGAIERALDKATDRFSYAKYIENRKLDDEHYLDKESFHYKGNDYLLVKPTKLHFAPNMARTINDLRSDLEELFPSLNIDTEPDYQITSHHIAFSV